MGIIKNGRTAWALGVLLVIRAIPSVSQPDSQAPRALLDGAGPNLTSPNEPCPTGVCEPIGNGEGVYFGKLADPRSKDYCLPGLCPEAFINGSGGITLLGRSRAGKPGQGTGEGHMTERYVFVSVNGGDDFAVTRIASQGGALAITYKKPDGQESTVMGADLANVAVKLRGNPAESGNSGAWTKLTLELVAPAGSYPKYTVTYDQSPGNPNPTKLCAGEPVSFLPGKRIEFRSAHVTSADVVTMSCESGAIAKCMNAGYTQWGAAGRASPPQIDDAFDACLQAVRAAYFVAQGDYKSYTVDGTEIYVRDGYGIQAGNVDRLEALWSSGGATCITDWRLPELKPRVPPKVTIPGPCHPDWTEKGTLATGLTTNR